jgi:flagellar motility protein MotE (MotC chaperone)
MARIPLVAVSAASAVVLFAGTSVGLLAFQGRLGTLLGKAPEEHAADAGDGAAKGEAPGAHAAAGKADGGKGEAGKGDTNKTDAGKSDANKSEAHKSETAKTDGGKAEAGKVDTSKVDANKTARGSEASHGDGLDAKSALPAAMTPKRIATASLVKHFTIPEPFSAKELEELVDSLKESQRSHESYAKELAAQRIANERDRADLDARFAELEGLRKKLDVEKIEVADKVAELAKRNDRLVAGEEKFVKATIARLATLKPDEAKTQLLDLDDAVAARVLQKMDPKACAKLLAILPADKRVSLTKQLRALSMADEEAAASKSAASNTK